MPLDQTSPSLVHLIQAGRQARLEDALSVLGIVVFDQDGTIACHGAAIATPDKPVFNGTARSIDRSRLTLAEDPILTALNLELIGVDEADCCDPSLVGVPALMLRIGLLGRILDTAHAHLKGRVSFGKKTLSHQLVKVGFSDAYGTMRLLSESAMQRFHTGNLSGLADDHADLTRATLAAEKLMGGHGYLLQGTHPLGYLSTLLHAIYGPRS